MLVSEIKLDRLIVGKVKGKESRDSEWRKNPEKADLRQYYDSKINF